MLGLVRFLLIPLHSACSLPNRKHGLRLGKTHLTTLSRTWLAAGSNVKYYAYINECSELLQLVRTIIP
jgi:hypothetical protein